MMKLKKNSKWFKTKKITIKKIRIKIEIQNKFYLLLKDEIKKKN
jgi:hypothetical protein